MNTITLSKPNHTTSATVRSKTVVRPIATAIIAFTAGILSVVKPMLLIAIPSAVLLYGIAKIAALLKEVLSMDFDLTGVEISQAQIIEELEM